MQKLRMTEIDGYNGKYIIYEDGSIFNTKTNKYVKHYDNGKGYRQVRLGINGIQRTYKVHRLVAIAFIDNPNNYDCINHKDEDKTNNHASNLEWCTVKYNNNYSKPYMKNSKKVICIDTNKLYETAREASNDTGVDYSNLISCCRNKRKTAGKLRWRYA